MVHSHTPRRNRLFAFLLLLRKEMFKIIDKTGFVRGVLDDLSSVMEAAKYIDEFVTISGNGMEIVGHFGVDSVKDGVCPDGVEYTWCKRR